ncbi:MAG: hypothetical protein EON98_06225, partial [Chitinophagaceae bacterium]
MRIFRLLLQQIFTKYVVKGIVIFILVNLVCVETIFSQQSYSIYQSLTTSNGLPSNYVFASGEDENGFLWVGTDKGLCRYDGFRWKIWDKDNGLPGNYINSVFPDKRGGLWLGISEKGYFHFQPATGVLQRLPFSQLPKASSIQTDNAGNLYAEFYEGNVHFAHLFHPTSVKIPDLIFSWKSSVPVVLSGNAKTKLIHCLSANAKDIQQIKTSWKGTWPLRILQLAKPYFKGQSIYYVSDSVVVSSTDHFLFSSNGALLKRQPLFPKGNSYAYTCITDSGLYVFNIKTGYYFFDRQNNKTFYDKSSGLGTDYVNHIYQTSDGGIIISTLGAGLQLIKKRYRKTYFTDNNPVKTIIPSNGKWYVLAGNKVYKKAIASNSLLQIGEAGKSALNLSIWGDTLIAGSLRGIFFYKEKVASIKQIGFVELTAGISSIIRQDNHFLAGTYGSGLLQFQFNKNEKHDKSYPLRIIEKLVPITDGFAALSYEDGVLLTNTRNGQHVQLSQKNGLHSNSVYSIY